MTETRFNTLAAQGYNRTHLGRQGRDHRRWRADPDDQLRGIPVAQVGVERAEGGEQPDPPEASP